MAKNVNKNPKLDWNVIKKNIRDEKKILWTHDQKTLGIHTGISLENCEIDNDILFDNVFNDFSQAITLNLSYNNLSYINLNLFDKMINLTKIKFINNQITHLDKNLFKGLQKITEINFSQNAIFDLKEEIFAGQKNLKKVFFFENKIKFLRKNLFKDCSNLEWVNFNNNRIKTLDVSLFDGECKSIKYIEMRDNQINHILGQNFFSAPSAPGGCKK